MFQGMGVRETVIQGVKNRNQKGQEIRNTGKECVCDGGAHVGECDRQNAAQYRDQNPILSLPQLNFGDGRAVQGVDAIDGQGQRDLAQ